MFTELLKKQIQNEGDYIRYVRSLYEEWQARDASGYQTFKNLGRKFKRLDAELPPQFFTGNIHSPVVIISLNPHADPKGRNSEIAAADYCKTWEDYFDFWTNFPKHRYARDGKARSQNGKLSKFDCKLHRFLSGSSDRVTSEMLARWNMLHMELFPVASPNFDISAADEYLSPYVLRTLETISLLSRDMVLVLNNQFVKLLQNMKRSHLIEFNVKKKIITIDGRKSKGYRFEYTVNLVNGKSFKIVSTPTFAAQGFDGAQLQNYYHQVFTEKERNALSKAVGIKK